MRLATLVREVSACGGYALSIAGCCHHTVGTVVDDRRFARARTERIPERVAVAEIGPANLTDQQAPTPRTPQTASSGSPGW
jgi:hypothetical protein